ncbi:MAG: DivIVA domain-containing protein, partial [Clostridia bacterium]
MMSPGELKDIQFDKAVFGGYDISAVDEVFAQVTADFTALFKENAVLKNKLKLLASTVEEYRGVDEAMRKALITAQNMANE